MISRKYLFLTSILVCLTGCGSRPNDSSPTAYVNYEQANRAFSKLAQVDYLPFGYKLDGCYARSLFMAMELAVDGIPSSAQFAVGDLRPSSEVSWRYHVVPMLIVGNDSEPTVFDPSLLNGPAKRSDWLKSMRANGFAELVAVPGSYYDPYSTPLREDERIIHSMSEMPAFQLEHVSRACSTLHSYLNNEGAVNRLSKQQKLQERAVALAGQLSRIQKLTNPSGYPNVIDCTGSPFD